MIKNVLITNLDTELIKVPLTETYAITGIFFCNHSDLISDYLTLYICNSSESIGNNTIVINSMEILPKQTFILSDIEKILLDENDFISAISINGTITATLSYMII